MDSSVHGEYENLGFVSVQQRMGAYLRCGRSIAKHQTETAVLFVHMEEYKESTIP